MKKDSWDELKTKMHDFDICYVHQIDWEKLRKNTIEKSTYKKYDAFGIDIVFSEFCPRYRAILLRRNDVVGIIDFTPWHIRLFESIKKFFIELWFKIIGGLNE